MRKNRLYVIATYKNKSILDDNVSDWSNDLRAQIFGSGSKFIKNKILFKRLSINDNLLYSGEYYHLYNFFRKKDIVDDKDSIIQLLQYEFSVISESNIVIVVIDEKFSYYSVIKFFSAVISNKVVIVFIDSNDTVTYEKWKYFISLCQNMNVNMEIFTDSISSNDIIAYIKTLNRTSEVQALHMCYGTNKILLENRLFLSSGFNVYSKEKISVDNVAKVFKNDIRMLLVSDKKKAFIENSNAHVMYKRYLKYNGSFYYYFEENGINNNFLYEYRNIPKSVMKRISSSDTFICVLKEKEQMDSVVELLYAAFLKKKVHIFCDKKIESSYSLLFLFVNMLTDDFKLTKSIDKNRILEFIRRQG